MSGQNENLFEFGPFVLDGIEQTLVRDGEEIPLPPKASALLLFLVSNAGRTIEKAEIMEAVWPETYVEEQNLVWTIHLLRKVLCDDANTPKYIETKPRRGYRFVGEVRKREVEPASTTDSKPLKPAESSRWLTFFSEDRWFLFTSVSLYALLYVVALLIEVAYDFKDYGGAAMKGAPLVFFWMWTT